MAFNLPPISEDEIRRYRAEKFMERSSAQIATLDQPREARVNVQGKGGTFSPYDAVFAKYAGDLAGDPNFIATVAAGTHAESGWDTNNTSGDAGHSWGLFQMHDQGAGAGMGNARLDPDAASRVMVPRYASAYRQGVGMGLTGAALASYTAAQAERPQGYDDPNSAARKRYANSYASVVGGELPVSAPASQPTSGGTTDFNARADSLLASLERRFGSQVPNTASRYQSLLRTSEPTVNIVTPAPPPAPTADFNANVESKIASLEPSHAGWGGSALQAEAVNQSPPPTGPMGPTGPNTFSPPVQVTGYVNDQIGSPQPQPIPEPTSSLPNDVAQITPATTGPTAPLTVGRFVTMGGEGAPVEPNPVDTSARMLNAAMAKNPLAEVAATGSPEPLLREGAGEQIAQNAALMASGPFGQMGASMVASNVAGDAAKGTPYEVPAELAAGAVPFAGGIKTLFSAIAKLVQGGHAAEAAAVADMAGGAARAAEPVAAEAARPIAPVANGVEQMYGGIPFPTPNVAGSYSGPTPSVNPGSLGAAARAKAGAVPPPGPPVSPQQYATQGVRFLEQKLVTDRADLKAAQSQAERAYQATNPGQPLPPELRAVELDRATGSSYFPARLRIQNELQPAYERAGGRVGDLEQFLELQDNIDKATSIAGRAGAQAGNARLFPGGLTVNESRAALNDLEQSVGPQGWTALQDAANGVYDYVKGLRQRMVDAGIWSQDFANQLAQQYPHYIPTNVLDYMNDPQAIAGVRKLTLNDDGLRRLTVEGTTRARENVTAALSRMAFEVERLAAKNEAAAAVYGWRSIDPQMGNLMRLVAPSYRAKPGEVMAHYFDNGTKYNVAIDKSLEPVITFAQQNKLPAMFTIPATITRETATGRNPLFALVGNPLMDVPSYFFRETTQYGVRGIPQIVKGLAEGFADAFQGIRTDRFLGPDSQRFLGAGGGQFNYFSGSQKESAQIAEQVRRGPGYVIRNPKDLAQFMWDLTPNIGARMELGPRVAAFKNAEAAGRDTTAAMMSGRTVTQDFSVGGEWTKAINQVVPFFNISTQTGPWLVRTARANPKNFFATVAAGVMAPTVAAEAWNRMDLERAQAYADVPDYVKRQGIVLMAPDPNAGVDDHGRPKYTYVMIPARNLGGIVIPTRAIAERAMGEASPEDWRSVFSDVVGSASPVQTDSAVGALGAFAPALYGTALQLALNKDFFRNRDITSETGNDRATAGSKAIAGLLGAQPSQVEFATRDLGNGVAGIVLAAVDAASKIKEGKGVRPFNAAPGEQPVVGGLVGRFVRYQGGQVDQDLGALRDQARDQILNARKQQLPWDQLAPQQQDAITRQAGELATRIVYGTEDKPVTKLKRLEETLKFAGIPDADRAAILSQHRQTYNRAAGAMAPVRERVLEQVVGR